MKQVCCLLMVILLLTGCAGENKPLTEAMQVRDRLLSASQCSFQASVTADYGDSMYTFSMDCCADQTGMIQFEIKKPETIAGIKGTISDKGGAVSFEDTALYFDLITDDQLTPASAPWIFLKTLRSGYISAVCMEGELLHITADDSYEEDSLTLDIWLSVEKVPVRADILYDGKRILSLEIENFVIS